MTSQAAAKVLSCPSGRKHCDDVSGDEEETGWMHLYGASSAIAGRLLAKGWRTCPQVKVYTCSHF